MSIADKIFVDTCRQIIDEGVWDTDLPVRPRWLDGTPAHTVKKFCIVNRYDLSKEFPIITLRRTAFKSAIDEILWIWQKKSNNVKDLNSHIWDSWADESGSIGKAYGYQLGCSDNYYHSCCFCLCFSDLTFARYIIEFKPAAFGILYDSLGSENLSAFGQACKYS